MSPGRHKNHTSHTNIVVQQTYGDNCQFLTDFQNSLLMEREVNLQQNPYIILPTIPSVCCRTTL